MLEYFYSNYESFKKAYKNENGDRKYIFDCDKYEEILKGHDSKKSKSKTAIHFDLLPQPFIGDVENAKIIICSLNPGYAEGDEDIDEPNKHGNDILEQLNPDNKNKTLFWLTEKAGADGELSGGAKWWQKKLDQSDKNASLVRNIMDLTKYSREEVFKLLSENMAAIELFPYHSAKFNQSYLKHCKSAEKIKEYVKELAENAKDNNRLICFTRSFAAWEVEKIQNKTNVICNPSVQNITFNVNKCFGKRILEHIKENVLK